MAAPDHKTDLYIHQMVYNRLPFLAESEANNTLLSMFIYEAMSDMEICFRIDKDKPEGEPTRVGNEEYYSIPQRMVIADLVAVNILMMKIMANIGGVANDQTGEDGSVSANNTKFLKSTKAGSVEVEWEQFDTKKTASLYMSAESMIKNYQQSAIRRAKNLGCYLCWGDEGLEIGCGCNLDVAPFIVAPWTPCSNNSTNNVERG